MTKILVTGANGFVGTALCAALRRQGAQVLGAVRGVPAAGQVGIGDLSGTTDWARALDGVETVVHLAARVHVMRDRSPDRMGDFRAVNVEASLALARQAQSAGAKRFIFISSIGVNGAETDGSAFTELTPVQPHSEYAVSKLEAELALAELCAKGVMTLTVIRPPLVYGALAPGNFALLLKLVRRGIPLPFGALDNRRSLIYIDNLVDFIATCVASPAAGGQIFLVSDGSDISTADIITCLSEGMIRPARLFPVPVPLLALGARLVGRRNMYTQLCGSCRIDIEKARRVLNWAPPTGSAEALRRAAYDYTRGNR